MTRPLEGLDGWTVRGCTLHDVPADPRHHPGQRHRRPRRARLVRRRDRGDAHRPGRGPRRRLLARRGAGRRAGRLGVCRQPAARRPRQRRGLRLARPRRAGLRPAAGPGRRPGCRPHPSQRLRAGRPARRDAGRGDGAGVGAGVARLLLRQTARPDEPPADRRRARRLPTSTSARSAPTSCRASTRCSSPRSPTPRTSSRPASPTGATAVTACRRSAGTSGSWRWPAARSSACCSPPTRPSSTARAGSRTWPSCAVHRKTGIGGALLRTAFAAYATKGRTAAGLGVDLTNPTGAYQLYTGVGMAVVFAADVYELSRSWPGLPELGAKRLRPLLDPRMRSGRARSGAARNAVPRQTTANPWTRASRSSWDGPATRRDSRRAHRPSPPRWRSR